MSTCTWQYHVHGVKIRGRLPSQIKPCAEVNKANTITKQQVNSGKIRGFSLFNNMRTVAHLKGSNMKYPEHYLLKRTRSCMVRMLVCREWSFSGYYFYEWTLHMIRTLEKLKIWQSFGIAPGKWVRPNKFRHVNEESTIEEHNGHNKETRYHTRMWCQ